MRGWVLLEGGGLVSSFDLYRASWCGRGFDWVWESWWWGSLSFVLNGIAGSLQHGLCDVFKNWDVSLFLELSFVFWELLFCNFSWWCVVEDTVFRNL